jgi:cell shape-determining protein MreC
MSDASKDVIIATLRNRIIGLENENKQLKERLKINLGKVYDEI